MADEGSRRRRYLFVVWEGGGTIPPELAIARRLVRRGHEVTVLGDPCVESDARSAGCEFTPYRRAPHRVSRAPETDLLREWEAMGQLGSFVRARDRLFCGPALQYALDVLDAVQDQNFDLVVSDSMLFGAMVGAERAGLPFALLMPNIYIYPAPGIPPIGPGWRPARGPLERLRDAAVYRLAHRLFDRGFDYVNEARSRLGLHSLEGFMDQVLRADRIFVLTSRAFDFPAHSLPPNVLYTGPELEDPAWVEPVQLPWNGRERAPLVAVSYSTTYQDQARPLSRTIRALEQLEVRALVTTGPSLDPTSFPAAPGIEVRRSAPHSQIFPHADAVVTHGGHGTVMKALAHGLPIVCVPMGRDQNDNAARIVASGAGVRLSPRATVRSLRKAIGRVLDDPSYREHAARISRAIAQEVKHGRVIPELERLAGAGRRDPHPVFVERVGHGATDRSLRHASGSGRRSDTGTEERRTVRAGA